MAFQVTREADRDIAELYSFGTLAFGLSTATHYAAGLRERFVFLSEFPRAARERLEVRPPVRILPYGSHIVAYRIEDEDVVIVKVLHHSVDWTDEL
jgi:toxin ParE1/3/4